MVSGSLLAPADTVAWAHFQSYSTNRIYLKTKTEDQLAVWQMPDTKKNGKSYINRKTVDYHL